MLKLRFLTKSTGQRKGSRHQLGSPKHPNHEAHLPRAASDVKLGSWSRECELRTSRWMGDAPRFESLACSVQRKSAQRQHTRTLTQRGTDSRGARYVRLPCLPGSGGRSDVVCSQHLLQLDGLARQLSSDSDTLPDCRLTLRTDPQTATSAPQTSLIGRSRSTRDRSNFCGRRSFSYS